MADTITIDAAAAEHVLGVDLDRAMPQIGEAVGERAQERLQDYPPEPPRSTYVRTGRLKAGWGVQPKPYGAMVQNAVPYAPAVQGARTQARVHQITGWPTDESVAHDVEQHDAGPIAERIITDLVRERS